MRHFQIFLVITLICTCIRSAAVSAGRVRVEMASVLSMEAVFAGYSSELLEEFDIFALQESEQLQSVLFTVFKGKIHRPQPDRKMYSRAAGRV